MSAEIFGSNHRFTRHETIEQALRFAGVKRFTLDVAGHPLRFWGDKWFSPFTGSESAGWVGKDGLSSAWFGDVWCNPPFSEIGRWVGRAWSQVPNTKSITMLLPANRTEQPFWQNLIEPYRDRGRIQTRAFVRYRLRTLFLPGRQRFDSPSGDAPKRTPWFGVVLLHWSQK